MTPTPAQVRSNPSLFAKKLLKVRDKKKRLVRLAYNAAQIDYLKNRTRRDLILKARQIGFSTMIQAELYRIATTRPSTTMTITDEDKNTAKMRTIANTFHENMPDDWRPERGKDGATIATYPESGSEAMSATAGNRKTGRAGTYTHFHGSEVAFWPDAQGVIAGALQGGNPSAVLESTANGAQDFFYEACMKAIDGDDAWKLHFYPWWILPEFAVELNEGEEIIPSDNEGALIKQHGLSPEQIKWRRMKQKEVGSLFPQEYPEDPKTCFLLSGRGYFGGLENVFDAPYIEAPPADHLIVAGLDWGMTDYTVLSIGDAISKCQIFLGRWNKMPWPEQRRQIVLECRRWGVTLLIAEDNSIGDVNIDELRREFIEADDEENLGYGDIVYAFNTNANSKTQALSGLHIALNEDGWKLLPSDEQKAEHRAYQSKQTASGAWTYSAPSGQHDDTVIANMLMINGSLRGSMATPEVF